jgi:hypothetical protein
VTEPGAFSTRAEPLSAGERRARLLLVLLCVLAPVLYLPRVLLGRTTPMPARIPPAWTHLVVVTVGAWAEVPTSDDAAPDVPGALGAFRRRASRIASVVAPSAARASSAASLWTGRYPRGHGVLSNALALPPGAWTLARAARSVDTRTAAFLQEPFVSATAIGGFDEVVEDAALDARALAERAADFLARTRGERALVWIHLADAGPRGIAVAAVLERLERALAETDRGPESALALALLSRDGGPPEPGLPAEASLARWTAPLWVALPGALSVGRRSDARLSLVDLGATLTLLLGLEVPADARQDGRGPLLWNTLRGGAGDPGVWIQGEHDVWACGNRRVLLDPAADAPQAYARDPEGGWRLLDAERAGPVLAEAAAAREALVPSPAASSEATVPARVPHGDWPTGWARGE